MPDARNWFEPLPEYRRRRFPACRREGIELCLEDGRRLINFAGNDYLGLSTHEAVCMGARGALGEAVGSGASRLVSGDDPLMHRLEAKLARWKGFESCLLVGSGMLANIGLLQALAGRHDHIFADRLNHASLVDGARLSGASLHRFHHLDMAQLAGLLVRHPAERRMIVSDGVFSMDGDCANIPALLALAEAHDTLLVVDDAHGTGTLGRDGRGLTALHGVAGHPRLIEVGTFGKAFGGYGAFILGPAELIDGLRQRQRTMIYSTALPVAVIAAAETALALIERGEQVQQLHRQLARFRAGIGGLGFMPSETAIQPLLIGEDAAALAMSARLAEAGFFVPAIRPPTVPEGTSRLRITLSAAHTDEQIDGLIAALKSAMEHGDG
ncbi:8-amino-7-oxononanoate synthase [Mariprofundus erugo]|uniref:8-amino-7-oxononanoate synthase n=1 Tax=Mariprofundus erugo TaxID=2528639 RepID=A0A5R9H0K3_9PROT|nr:8-amino-7-oxononanoate synthase [Mariprofundus erugo]TLS68554.1 8-amino-7-oxononanoate synthase [Mariprofundus erugo]